MQHCPLDHLEELCASEPALSHYELEASSLRHRKDAEDHERPKAKHRLLPRIGGGTAAVSGKVRKTDAVFGLFERYNTARLWVLPGVQRYSEVLSGLPVGVCVRARQRPEVSENRIHMLGMSSVRSQQVQRHLGQRRKILQKVCRE